MFGFMLSDKVLECFWQEGHEKPSKLFSLEGAVVLVRCYCSHTFKFPAWFQALILQQMKKLINQDLESMFVKSIDV